MIFMLAPTSTPARRASIAKRTGGFLYYVSLTGITGAKLADIDDVRENVARIRRVAGVPVVVGFGIATAEDVARIAPLADGVVVGTAMVRTIDAHRDDPQLLHKAEGYVRALKAATRQASRATA
jgi:tryptophan synthase alpha chain